MGVRERERHQEDTRAWRKFQWSAGGRAQGQQIGDAFFAALERVRGIHSNCRSLLRTAHQRAGLELMDLMSSYQETAYEHLCRHSSFPPCLPEPLASLQPPLYLLGHQVA